MPDARAIPLVTQCLGRRATQANSLINLAQQQQPTIGTQIPTLEIRLDGTPPHPPNFNPLYGPLWRRQTQLFMASNTNTNAPPGRSADLNS